MKAAYWIKGMNNKKVVVPALILSVTMIFTGCQADPVAVAEDAAKKAAQSDASDGTKQQSQVRKRADLMGQVKSIVGNSVVLELAKMPTRDTNSTSGGSTQGGPPDGGMPPSGGQRSLNLALTGETKEIMIPVGITISSGLKEDAKTIDIADIEKGDVLMIYYSEGTEDVERIVVR